MSPTSDKAFNVAILVLYVVMSSASPQAFSFPRIDCMSDVLLIYLHWNVCAPTPLPPFHLYCWMPPLRRWISHLIVSNQQSGYSERNTALIRQSEYIKHIAAESYSKLDRSYYLKPPIGILNLPSTTTFIVWLQQLHHSDPGLGRLTGDLLSSCNYVIPIRA